MCRQAIQLVCKSLPRFSLFYISLLKQMSQRHNACFLLFGQEPRLPVDDLLGHSAVWWPARLRDPASGRWCWACCALEGPYAGNHSFGHGLWPPFAASISRWLTSASDTDDEQCLVLTPRSPASVAVVVPPVQGHPPRAWTSPPVHQWLHLCLSLDALGVWQKKNNWKYTTAELPTVSSVSNAEPELNFWLIHFNGRISWLLCPGLTMLWCHFPCVYCSWCSVSENVGVYENVVEMQTLQYNKSFCWQVVQSFLNLNGWWRLFARVFIGRFGRLPISEANV